MTDILIVLFVAVLVFGAFQVPALGDALGRAVRGGRGAREDREDRAAPPPAREGPPPRR